jgi:hypothetical protein
MNKEDLRKRKPRRHGEHGDAQRIPFSTIPLTIILFVSTLFPFGVTREKLEV